MKKVKYIESKRTDDIQKINPSMNYRVSAYATPVIAETERLDEAIKIAEKAVNGWSEVRITEYASKRVWFLDA